MTRGDDCGTESKRIPEGVILLHCSSNRNHDILHKRAIRKQKWAEYPQYSKQECRIESPDENWRRKHTFMVDCTSSA